MFRPRLAHLRDRRAIVLLIIVSMLTLFAVIGLAFVIYAESQATAARVWREAFSNTSKGLARAFNENDPGSPTNELDQLANTVLSQILYGPDDTQAVPYSALYGHELARAVYGWSSRPGGAPIDARLHRIPYNGTGLIYGSNVNATAQGLPAGVQDHQMVNFSRPHFPSQNPRTPPEYPLPGNPPQYVAKNAPYTAVDLNNMYLAKVNIHLLNPNQPFDPNTNPWIQDIIPSFYRDEIFRDPTQTTPAVQPGDLIGLRPVVPSTPGYGNPRWNQNFGRYLTLRPTKFDHPNFPDVPANSDGTTTGDVTNIPNKPYQRHDSIWIDIDLPVRIVNGKRVKPLIAPLIIDLDGRINVNVAGNLMGNKVNTMGAQNPLDQRTHGSNQGWGPWEISMAQLFEPNGAPTGQGQVQARHLLLGDPAFPSIPGRYGSNTTGNPRRYDNMFGTNISPRPQIAPGFYARADYDGFSRTANDRMRLPGRGTGADIFELFSVFADSRYKNGLLNTPPQAEDEGFLHPSLYNSQYLRSDTSGATTNRVFSPAEIRYLNSSYENDPASDAVSELARLAPSYLGSLYNAPTFNPAFRINNRRFLVTTVSSDFDRPGMSPWQSDTNNNQHVLTYQAAQASNNGILIPDQFPEGNPNANPQVNGTIPFPNIGPVGQQNGPNQGTEFSDRFTWEVYTRNVNLNPVNPSRADFVMKAVDLNRPLRDYRDDPAQTYENANYNNAIQAIQDRQQFARDIFDRLCVATGSRMPGDAFPAQNDRRYDALRMLAQLAVNIVDYVDKDDFSTPFEWHTGQNPPQFVYGFELPRLVINEAFVYTTNELDLAGQIDTGLLDRSDDPPIPPVDQREYWKARNYDVRVWVELHNPLTPPTTSNPVQDSNLSENGAARLEHGGQSVYRLVMTRALNTQIHAAGNTKGIPDAGNGGDPDANGAYPTSLNGSQFAKFDLGTTPGSVVLPSNAQNVGGTPAASATQRGSFVLVGPGPLVPGAATPINSDLTIAGMSYKKTANAATRHEPISILLQRKLCPYLPFDATLNPYVTVDFFDYYGYMTKSGDRIVWDEVGTNALYSVDPITNTQRNEPPVPLSTLTSWGRRQPYAGFQNPTEANLPAGAGQEANSKGYTVPFLDFSNWMGSRPGGNNNNISSSFGRHNKQTNDNNAPTVNDTIDGYLVNDPNQTKPLRWLTHLDRPLISPYELLQVTARKPHQVTKFFMLPQGNWFGSSQTTDAHIAAWRSNSTRLFRAVGSLLTTSNRGYGTPIGGRVSGRVNINTVWDQRILQALADRNDANYFSNQMITNPGFVKTPTSPYGNDYGLWGVINQLHQPVVPFQGQPTTPRVTMPIYGAMSPLVPNPANLNTPTPYPVNMDVARTPMAGEYEFDVADPDRNQTGTHPYINNELIRKIGGNLTTRSNTFAIWVTVGYFEVENDGPYNGNNRPRLGKELGTDDGNIIRPRFFSIIDRTMITQDPVNNRLQGNPPVFFEYMPLQSDIFNDHPVPTVNPAPQIPVQPVQENQLTIQANTRRFVHIKIPAKGSYQDASLPTGYQTVAYGDYEGQQWTLRRGDTMDLDINESRETVRIEQVVFDNSSPNPPTNNNYAIITIVPHDVLNPGNTSNNFLFNHYPGCALQIGGILGNPGPQPQFNYTADRYKGVVRYFAQLN